MQKISQSVYFHFKTIKLVAVLFSQSLENCFNLDMGQGIQEWTK